MDACLRRHVPLGCGVTIRIIPDAAQRRSGIHECSIQHPNFKNGCPHLRVCEDWFMHFLSIPGRKSKFFEISKLNNFALGFVNKRT